MRDQAAAPAVAERVRRMEDAGIITGCRVELRLEKLFPVTGIIPRERARGELRAARRLRAEARRGARVLPRHRPVRPKRTRWRAERNASSGTSLQ